MPWFGVKKCAFPQNLRDPTCKQKIRSFVAYPGSARATQPNLTHETNRVARTIATAAVAVASSSSSRRRRRRRCVVVVRPKCATNYPKSNSISTDHQKHTHTQPATFTIHPTNQPNRWVVTLMMTSISILMTLRSCYTFSASSETDFLLTNPQPVFERDKKMPFSSSSSTPHRHNTNIITLSEFTSNFYNKSTTTTTRTTATKYNNLPRANPSFVPTTHIKTHTHLLRYCFFLLVLQRCSKKNSLIKKSLPILSRFQQLLYPSSPLSISCAET